MNKTITLLLIGVIFLALLLMVFNSFKTEERQGLPTPVTEKASPQEDAQPARVPVATPMPAPALAPAAPEAQNSAALPPAPPRAQSSASLPSALPSVAPQLSESAAQASSTEVVTGKTVPAQIDAGQAAPAAVVPQTAAPSLPPPPKIPAMPEPSAKQTSGGAKNITSIVVYATQEGATLRMVGDKALQCTSMLLRGPDRLVLDCEGQWNMNVPGVPQNRLIKTIRVGRQADSTRMVIDLHRAPASYRLVKTSPQGLDVRLR
jgi:hypothetical protein